jgi:nitroreductase
MGSPTMSVLDVIRTRRSIGQFKPDPVPSEAIAELLEAVVWTPNHHLTEPWAFYVLGSESKRRFAEIRRDARRDTLPNPHAPEAQPALQKLYDTTLATPVIIVFTAAGHADPEWKEENEWATFGAAYAFMLGAWAQGIGTYFRTGRGVLGSPELRALLDLPADRRIIGVVYAGYPETVPQKKRTPAAEKTVWLP